MVLALAVSWLEDVALVGQVYVDDGVVRRLATLTIRHFCFVVLLIGQLGLTHNALDNFDSFHHRAFR